jgi:uncharacterized protein (DUF2147 family)
MKKLIVSGMILLVSFTVSFAQQSDAVKGTWLNDAKDAKVEIYKTGDKYAGKIVWTKNMYEADGKTLKKDSKNSNETLRNRSILNLVILTGFTYDDGEWINGEIYDPKNGKTYKSKMKLSGSSLEIRGYVGSPVFGKTTSWTKVS